MRSLVAALNIFLTLVMSIAPAAPAFAAEPAASEAQSSGRLKELVQTEEKLHHYFEGCNNHISDTLRGMKLDRDAGDRPTPIMILGMNEQDENASQVPFTDVDEMAMNADMGAGKFLKGIYVQGLRNTETAWIRMMVQYNGAKLDPASVADKICKLGTKCTPAARTLVMQTAQEAIKQTEGLPRYTWDSAADIINQEVRRANDELDLIKIKPKYTFTEFVKGLPHGELKVGSPEGLTPAQLARYSEIFTTAVNKDGPMRLLAIPRLNSRVGTLQTPYRHRALEDVMMEFVDARDGKRYPARWSNGYGTQVRDHRLPNDGLIKLAEPYDMLTPHSYITPGEIKSTVADGIGLLEDLIGDLNDSVSPKALRTQKKVQAGIVSILGGTGLAAHQVLLDYPELAPSACRAFKQFAIEHAESHKWDRYKRNIKLATGVVVAVIGTVIQVMEIPAYALLTEAVGEVAISTIGWAVTVGLTVNSVVTIVSESSKRNANVRAVLAGNEASEVIISRIPEEIDAVSSGYTDLLMNVGFVFLNTWYVVRDVQLWMDAPKLAQVAEPAVVASLSKTLLIGAGKVAFSTSKFTPVMLKAMSYWSFKDLQGTTIQWEETPGSGVLTKARADTFDDKRQYVELTVISVTGPDGKPIPPTVKEIEMPDSVFRSVIRGTR